MKKGEMHSWSNVMERLTQYKHEIILRNQQICEIIEKS